MMIYRSEIIPIVNLGNGINSHEGHERIIDVSIRSKY
jgi:hypothetical protein